MPSILNPVINFSTQLWPVKWKCPRLYLCLAHSILSPLMLMQHMHQPITNAMIYFISSHDCIGLSILTSLALYHCLGPSMPSLAQASASQVVLRFKASDLPSTLAIGLSSQASSWSSPPWSHESISCLICNELLHHHIFMWTNLLCISHKHILVYLSCHSITKTKQGPFKELVGESPSLVLDNWWNLCVLTFVMSKI